ncbi:mpv17 / PMP22 family domain-containing protein [Phthorimaea operculella]|nr:mpv17 / PMP22 family domain-containing protein [Phthorimaea operculella]
MAIMSRLVGWFKHSLKTRPVLTNTAVYATFYSAAEFSQQTYNKIYLKEEPDFKSAARVVAVGSTLYAPILYHWYKFLDRKFAGTAVKMVATKVFLDQFTMTPVLIATFFTLLGILERKEDIFEELREKYKKTFIANQMFWIPGQTINFSLVPPNFRVVYVASASFLWINVICFIKREKIVKEMPLSFPDTALVVPDEEEPIEKVADSDKEPSSEKVADSEKVPNSEKVNVSEKVPSSEKVPISEIVPSSEKVPSEAEKQ